VNYLKKDKLKYIQKAISICLLLQMLLSFKLWWPQGRIFPLIPAFDFLPISFSGNLAYLPASLFALLLLLGIFFSGNRVLLIATLILATVLVLEDINRLQVWFYQLTSMLVLLFMAWRIEKEVIVSNLQMILIFIYFWSGFNKLSVYYMEDTFPWLMEVFPFLSKLGDNQLLAIGSALVEIVIAIGLLFTLTRKWAIGLAYLLHLFILMVLGPLGYDWNQVVWPWNICQMVFLYLLFHQSPQLDWINTVKKAPFTLGVIFLFGLMPALNLIHKWPDQLSFKMYSGTYSEGVIYAEAIDGICFLQHQDMHQGRSPVGKPEVSLILDDWALSELGVTPFVNERFYYRLGLRYCACFEDPTTAGIWILTVDRWDRTKESYNRLSCKELEGGWVD